MDDDISFIAAGPAGSGVMSLGALFGKCLQHAGYSVFQTADYPSLIKGGHNIAYVRGRKEDVHAHRKTIDLLLAIDKITIEKHQHSMTKNGVIIQDEKVGYTKEMLKRSDITLLSIPLSKLAQQAGGSLYANTVALGCVIALVRLPKGFLNSSIEKLFGKKGEKVLQENNVAANLGYDHIAATNTPFSKMISPLPHKRTLLISGNAAASAGAIKAGLKLVAEYPMTPSSSVLHYMAAQEQNFNIIVKHTEDEIAAMNMLVGAGFAGVRCLTATSGGGFSLMVEGLGLAGISETPCVILESQRCGPSTGLPTYTEQADLKFALHASQGEFPRVVLAPGDPEEAFFHTFHAFNIADHVQTPVIILLDKHLSESAETVPYFEQKHLKVERGKLLSTTPEGYKRHELTADGISPRVLPGTPGGMHACSSYEHDESGFTSEEPHNRIAQIDKRQRKLMSIDKKLIAPVILGDEHPDVLIVCWGSTKGSAREAMRLLSDKKIKTRLLHIIYMCPFPADDVAAELKKAKKSIIFEGNMEQQLRNVIREKTGILIPHTYNRYDGRPFDPEEIASEVEKVVRHG